MFKKIIICLSQPTQIGLFLGEKIRKTIVELLVFALLAIIPCIFTLCNTQTISNDAVDNLLFVFMHNDLDFDLKIEDGVLSGEDGILMEGYESYIFINPNQEKMTGTNKLYPVTEFTQTSLRVHYGSLTLFERNYKDLGIENLNFTLMMEQNYTEFNRFVDALNVAFQGVHPTWVIINLLFVFIETFVMAILSALLLAAFSSMINENVSFRFRFKIALDCQFIMMVFALLSYLFQVTWVQIIGLVLSVYYLIRALSTIVRIEVKTISARKNGE